MSLVMTRCPVTGRAVSTGIDTASVIVDSLPDVAVRMRCPECGREHLWRRRDTWLAHGVAPARASDTAA
jgi:hypothetical protein